MNFYESRPPLDLSILNSNYENTQYNNSEVLNDLTLKKIYSSLKNKNIFDRFDRFQSIEENNITESFEQTNRTKFELDEMNNQDLDMTNLEKIDNIKIIKDNQKLEDYNSYKSTGEKSKSEENKSISKIIFGTKTKKDKKPIEIRIDYAIKNVKTYITKFIKEYGNNIVQKCHFSSVLKNLKLFAPSYPYFTGNAKDKDNKAFKNFTVEQIFEYPPEKKQNAKKDNRLQRQNKDIIKAFKDYIENNYPDTNERPYEYQELLNFFRMRYEDIVLLFYNNSSQYKEFISSEKSKKFDQLFIKIKGYSLIEKNGFLKFLSN